VRNGRVQYKGRVIGQALDTAIEDARQSDGFRTYLRIRDWVVELLHDDRRHAEAPSSYWRDELAGLDYMLDASPLVIRSLREHGHHFTSVRPYDYRRHHAHQIPSFAERLRALRQIDPRGLFVAESPRLGGFGHEIGGQLVNLDTLRYYECLIAMDRAGFLDPFRGGATDRPLLLEIGGGWGGFAYQFKCLHPGACYVIVDFPEALLFSAVYLTTMFPDASILTVGPASDPGRDWRGHDFVFVPHYLFHRMRLPSVDLADHGAGGGVCGRSDEGGLRTTLQFQPGSIGPQRSARQRPQDSGAALRRDRTGVARLSVRRAPSRGRHREAEARLGSAPQAGRTLDRTAARRLSAPRVPGRRAPHLDAARRGMSRRHPRRVAQPSGRS
jgi:hypothetical protein